jgi:hypothetical protein
MFEVDYLIFKSRLDACAVLTKMFHKLGENGHVTLANYYDICGLTHDHDTSMTHGWNSLEGTYIISVGSGYKITFPDPVRLDELYKYNTERKSDGTKEPIILSISRVDLLSKKYIKEEYIEQIGKVTCVCGVYKTIRSVLVTEHEVIVELT